MFRDREEAAGKLAEKLEKYKDNKDVVVLAIPRGGVPMGYIVSQALHVPLDIALIKKIGHPYNKEYAIGAVSLQSRVINETADVERDYIEDQTEKMRDVLLDRYSQYLRGKKPIDLKNKTVIIVDDGIATGSTLLATIQLLKKSHAKKLVVAIPVGPPTNVKKIEREVDEMICLYAPASFSAVGQFYEVFEQTTDEEVVDILNKARRE